MMNSKREPGLSQSKKIRVLWFANTPSLAAKKYGDEVQNSGSWIAAAELALSQNTKIDFAVVFLTDSKEARKFVYRKRVYYPIRRKKIGAIFGVRDMYSKKDLQWILADYKPSLIQVFGTEGPFGKIVDSLDIPVIVVVQGFLQSIKDRTGRLIGLPYIVRRMGVKVFGSLLKYFSASKATARESEIIGSVKYFIGQTQWVEDRLEILAGKHRYFNNSSIVREIFFNLKRPQPFGGTVKIISVISPRPYKGLEQILQTARILSSHKVKFSWKIAGVPAKHFLVRAVEDAQKSLFSRNGIQFMGVINEKRLARELTESNVFVHPSHIENECVSVMEAMLVGLPVIANFVGGLSSWTYGKDIAIFVPDGDARSMAANIIALKNDPERADALGRKAYQFARKEFNTKNSVKDLMAIYQEVIGDS